MLDKVARIGNLDSPAIGTEDLVLKRRCRYAEMVGRVCHLARCADIGKAGDDDRLNRLALSLVSEVQLLVETHADGCHSAFCSLPLWG